MGLGEWFRKIFGIRPKLQEMVPFLDGDSGKIVRIPVSELRPGTVQVRLQETGEVVWALPDQLQPADFQHPEFDEEVRDCIRQIHKAFAEHRPLSFEEWEDGFRRDGNPAREIAIWLHAASVYQKFAANEPDPACRWDIYRCLVACMTATGPEEVWKVFRPAALSREQAATVIKAFGGQKDPS